MAQIPLGSFAQPSVLPQAMPSQVERRTLNRTEEVGRAAEGMGAQISSTGNQLASDAVRQHNEELQHKTDEARQLAGARMLNSALDHRLSIEAAAQQRTEDIATGAAPYVNAAQDFHDNVAAKIPVEQVSGLDPAQQENYDRTIKQNTNAAMLKVQAASYKAQQADYTNQAQAAANKFGKLAASPTNTLADIDVINGQIDATIPPLLRNGRFDQAQASKIVQDLKDSNVSNFVHNQIISNRQNLDGLKQIDHDLTDPKGAYVSRLEPAKRNTLQQETEQWAVKLENAINAAHDKRENQALTETNKYLEEAATGLPIASSRSQDLLEAAKGTSSEQDAKSAVAIAGEVQKVRALPFAQQAQYIAQQQTALHTTPSEEPKREKMFVDTLTNMFDANQKLAQKDPMQFHANQTGQIAPPLDLSKLHEPGGIDAIVKQMEDRYTTLKGDRAHYGPQVSMNPLHPADQEVAKQVFTNFTADSDKLQFLGAFAKAAPDMQSYQDTIKPLIGHEDRIAYLAGIEQYQGHMTKDNGSVASLLLKGQRMLSNKNSTLPEDPKFRVAFNNAVGNAYPQSSQAREDAFTRYKAIYAAIEPIPGRGNANVVDEGRLGNAAVTLATGGIGEYNGVKTVMPFGMDVGAFRDAAHGAMLAALPFTSDDPRAHDIIASAHLQPVQSRDGSLHEGVYLMVLGRTPLISPDGHALWVKIPATAPNAMRPVPQQLDSAK